MPGGQGTKWYSRPLLTVTNHLFHFSSVSVALLTQREWSWRSQPCRTPPSKLSMQGSQQHCSDMLNTFLKTGCDGDTSFSVFTVALRCYLFSALRTGGHPTFINIICIIHSQLRIETSVLVYCMEYFYSNLSIFLEKKFLDSSFEHIWGDVLCTRSSWANSTDSSTSSTFSLTHVPSFPSKAMDFSLTEQNGTSIIYTIFSLGYLFCSLPNHKAVCIFKSSK